MLNLIRKFGQQLKIGDDVVITVIGKGNNKNQVRIGIDAPKDVHILRQELTKDEAKKIKQGIKSTPF